MRPPIILTSEWEKKKKKMADELLKSGELFFTLQRQKLKGKKTY